MITTKTEQTWEKLVWAETNCSGCNGKGSYQMFDRPEPGFGRTCGRCGGTGKAPLLPMLREPCHALHNLITANSISTATPAEAGCSGWQAKPIDMALLLDGMRKAGFTPRISGEWIVEENRRSDAWSFFDDNQEYPSVAIEIDDKTASIEAAWKAVEARHPQKEKR